MIYFNTFQVDLLSPLSSVLHMTMRMGECKGREVNSSALTLRLITDINVVDVKSEQVYFVSPLRVMIFLEME